MKRAEPTTPRQPRSVRLRPIRTSRSLVEETYARLLEAVRAGRFESGQRLPSEPQLAAQLGVSRGTIREALGQLQREGHIHRRPGDGTYIADTSPAFVERLELFKSIRRVAEEQGIELSPDRTEFVTRPADVTEAKRLELKPGEPIHVVTRTLSSDLGPLVHMVDVLPARLIAMEELRARYTGVIREQLIDLMPDIAYARSELFTTWAEPRIAARLGLPTGSVLLVIEEIVCGRDDRPVNYSVNYYNAAKCRFQLVQRRGDPP